LEGLFQMRLSSKLLLALVALFLLQPLMPQQAMPRMTTVEPASGKIGDVLSVTGENLEKTNVAEVFLTDGKNDLKVVVSEQSATGLKFKIPEKAKAGRFALMILTTGKEPQASGWCRWRPSPPASASVIRRWAWRCGTPFPDGPGSSGCG
jgi:hypothetical protein